MFFNGSAVGAMADRRDVCRRAVVRALSFASSRKPVLLERDDTEVVVAAGARLRQVRVHFDEGWQDVVALLEEYCAISSSSRPSHWITLSLSRACSAPFICCQTYSTGQGGGHGSAPGSRRQLFVCVFHADFWLAASQ